MTDIRAALVPDEMPTFDDDDEGRRAYSTGWNACRKEMITALQAANERAERLIQANGELACYNLALNAQLAAQQADAERYRFLRSCAPYRSDVRGCFEILHGRYQDGAYLGKFDCYGENLDVAIDAALQAGSEG